MNDLLIVIGAWGEGAGVGDVDCDYLVDIGDLLDVIGSWGLCSTTPGAEPSSLADIVTNSGLDWPEDWNTFQSILTVGSQSEQENAICWMNHYLLYCDQHSCTCASICSGSDPFLIGDVHQLC